MALTSWAQADDAQFPLRNMNGQTGLIDTASARMAPDGALSLSTSFFKNTQHYDLDFQLLPWLETDFLYSGLTHWDPTYPVYWDRAFSFKARLLQESDLLPAVSVGLTDFVGTGVYTGQYLVASKQFGTIDATVGLGWNRLASANKIRNPLTYISQSFNNTGTSSQGLINLTTFFKGPNSGIFGGLSWNTPIENLSLIAEYSSDGYTQESERGNFSPRSQLNFGLSYHAFDTMTLGLNWLYGRSFGTNISFQLDPSTESFPVRIGPALPPVNIRTDQEQQLAISRLLDGRNGSFRAASVSASNLNSVVDALWSNDLSDISLSGHTLVMSFANGDARNLCENAANLIGHYNLAIDNIEVRGGIRLQKCGVPREVRPTDFITSATMLSALAVVPDSLLTIDASEPPANNRKFAIAAIQSDAAKQQIMIQALSLTDTEAIVYYSNLQYLHEKDAIDRLVRVLMADAPPTVEKFRLIATLVGVPLSEFDILRGPTERNIAQSGRYSLIDGGNTLTSPPLQNSVLTSAERQSYPHFSWALYPLFRQELFDPSNPFAVQLLAGLQGIVEPLPGVSLVAEGEGSVYDNFNTARPADSVLPHVRTDWAKFFTDGKNGIGQLDAQYHFRFAPDVFGLVRAGYLESMFAGFGGEILWRPETSRWALDVDAFNLEERKFDRLFGLQPYRILTGHVTLYYASPWYDLNFEIRAGQYLAGDRGLTFQVSRRFETGVEIGVFATKTNVSAAQFGEGGFDKGFIINIPIGYTLPINTQAQLSTIIRPVQRDGGQTMNGDATLYEQVRQSGYGDIARAGDIVVH